MPNHIHRSKKLSRKLFCLSTIVSKVKKELSVSLLGSDEEALTSLFSVLQFFACLLIIFGAEIAAGVFGFINKEQVQHLSDSFF